MSPIRPPVTCYLVDDAQRVVDVAAEAIELCEQLVIPFYCSAQALRIAIEGSGEIAGTEVGGPSVPVLILSFNAPPGMMRQA